MYKCISKKSRRFFHSFSDFLLRFPSMRQSAAMLMSSRKGYNKMISHLSILQSSSKLYLFGFFLLSITLHSAAASSDLIDAHLQQLCARFPAMEVCQPSEEALQPVEKRKSAYMRFGRAGGAEMEPEMEKRKSAYMRFGKRVPSATEEGGIPYQQMLALNEPAEGQQMEKRKSAYMRFGKRKSAYMRFGRK